jgi:L-fuconolactonase
LHIAGTIAVQADETPKETRFLLDLAEKNDFIKGVVGWINLHTTDLAMELSAYAHKPKLVGFRSVIQGAPDAKYLTNKIFLQNLKQLAQTPFTYDLLVYHNQLPALVKMTDKLPDNHLILDHFGKPDIKNKQFKDWKENLRILSTNPRIYCKMSGMITEADYARWTYDDLMPYMETAAEFFGTDRICFGSDWPVCLVAGSYKQVHDTVDKFIQQLTIAEQEKIFGLNAIQFYKLKYGSSTQG